MKYWARSVSPLLVEKGYFETKDDIVRWLDKLFQISKEKTEGRTDEAFLLRTLKEATEHIHILNLANDTLGATAFLKEAFPYTNFNSQKECHV